MSDTVFALHQFVSHMKRGPKSVYEIVKKNCKKLLTLMSQTREEKLYAKIVLKKYRK